MALGYQARALRKGLAKLGEPSFLDGVDVGKVVLARNVEVFAGIGDTANDNPTVHRLVVAIDVAYAPRVGQTIAHPDGNFVLDALLEDNGVVRQFVVAVA